MEKVELVLWDLPTVVIEEILLRLNLSDRKAIRLTCKRLYELCNCPRICMKEKIIWREIDMNIVNVPPALLKIGRSCYNLVIENEYYSLDDQQKSTLLQFFKENAAKVRLLVIKHTYFMESFLEPLIMSCEGLQSLTLSFTYSKGSPSLDYFTLEPNTVTRPTVTYLELILPKHQPSKYFHRMLSVFPNVQQLKIEMEQLGCQQSREYVENLNLETAQECSPIFDDIMKCGNNLKSLKLNISLSQLIAKGPQFCKTFSNLKNLSIRFNGDASLGEPEKFFTCFSNLEALTLLTPRSLQLKRVLKNTKLNYLKVYCSPYSLDLNEDSFIELVSSKLKILHLGANKIEGLPMTVLNFPLEANTTVTNLYLTIKTRGFSSPVQLFSMYFRGLVHLSIYFGTDEILQYIFRYQQNLRSLDLGNCLDCSQEGFCGSKDGRLEYSINNLQKLEHLSIDNVPLEIIASDEFKDVFNLPSLEYLRIDLYLFNNCVRRYAKVPSNLYENLTHLRALRIRDIAIPSRETISSLFTNLKHLNYLRFDMDTCGDEGTDSIAFINTKEFSINTEDYNYAYTLAHAYYDEKLDRMVILNGSLNRTLSSPKISSYQIKWIRA